MVIKQLYLFFCLFFFNFLNAQTVNENLQKAVTSFEKDNQMENGIFSFYVINADTKATVFAKNENIGLATASCLKVITSATAFELLGAEYRFCTKLYYTGIIDNGTLNGNLIIQGSGDPTFGSWRWEQTKTNIIINRLVDAIQKKGIKTINGKLIIQDGESKNVTPSNWIWEDLGNYYGAPARLFNWRENQYDLHFATGKNSNEATTIINVDPDLPDIILDNETKTGAPGSGDQSVIYLPPHGSIGTIKGTVPAGVSDFVVSGAMPNPTRVFAKAFTSKLKSFNIKLMQGIWSTTERKGNKRETAKLFLLDTLYSPGLDKINYWFLKKSINLYGEALLNTLGDQKNVNANFENKNGIAVVQKFWEGKGIPVNSLNIYDGSGLSPSNRVTTKTLVKVLAYAREQPWFNTYFEAFPVYNDMKLKSGTIGDVKGFSGYHTAKDGTKYIVAFLVNNYNGSAKALVNKMYKVLDVLK